MRTTLFLLATALCTSIFSQTPRDEMVLIPAGEFTMGKNSTSPTDWQPEHRVKVNSFYMDKYEVTNQEYYNFCMATKNPFPQFWGMKEFKSGLDFPRYPVVGVSHSDAEKCAKWSGKRLPSEAEWEYAARGGLSNKNYPLGDQTDSTMINYGRKYKGILEVGSFPPNGYGLYDITGNVWEWISDF
jgi:formylglycine-generating enzyme required for sulfatase activity